MRGWPRRLHIGVPTQGQRQGLDHLLPAADTAVEPGFEALGNRCLAAAGRRLAI